MEISRDFKGIWIPKSLWLDDSLSPSEKCLLSEIDSLSKNGDGCYASNEYLAKFMHMTEGSLKNMLSHLRKGGYIVDCGFDGRRRFVKAVLQPGLPQGSLKSDPCRHPFMTIENSIEQSIEEPPLSPLQGDGDNENINYSTQSTKTGLHYLPQPDLSPHKGEGGGGPPALTSKAGSPKRSGHPGSLDAVKDFAMEIGMTIHDAESFYWYQESKGWVVGRSPMKDWKAAMRRWRANSAMYARTDASRSTRPCTDRNAVLTKDGKKSWGGWVEK